MWKSTLTMLRNSLCKGLKNAFNHTFWIRSKRIFINFITYFTNTRTYSSHNPTPFLGRGALSNKPTTEHVLEISYKIHV